MSRGNRNVLHLYDSSLKELKGIGGAEPPTESNAKIPPAKHIGYWPKRMAVKESDESDIEGATNYRLEPVGLQEKGYDDDEADNRSIDEGAAGRLQWGKQIEFLLSCVGYSVGLGNIWRFPYLCMKHGGGAFLVPYLSFLFICGMPLFFLELLVGQSTGLTTVRAFNMIPIFQGLGWCMVAASGILSIYYNVIIAWVLYYLGMSFNWNLPWAHCNNTWNTDACFTYSDNSSHNATYAASRTSSTEEFWRYNVLEISDGIEDINGVNWKLLIAMIAAWVLTFICMCKGIRSSGKVVYVTAVAPYIFLTIILIRGVTLPGAWEGIKLYIVPDWNRLTMVSVWSEAATQIFYSLGPAWGGLMTFASFNKYNHKVMRDALIIPTICGLTSIYGGFAIFSVIGHLMHETGNYNTTQFVSQGPGLAFVAYPQALSKLPGAAIWSVFFFLMLLTLGIDSQFATLETVTTGLIDRFPKITGKHRILVTAGICLLEFFVGFILVTRAGFYYFQLFDDLATAFSVVVIGFLEIVAFAYFYGVKRLLKDVEDMNGKVAKCLRYWWTATWLVLVPLFTFAIIVSTFIKYGQETEIYLNKYPMWAFVVGWIIACLSFIEFPIFAIVAAVQHRSNWRKLFKFSEEWQYCIEERKKLSNGRTSCSTL